MADTLSVIPAPALGCEPEEAPAKRSIDMTAPVQVASRPQVVDRWGRPALEFPDAVSVGRVSAPMTAEMSAGEVATLLRGRCARCTHFRKDVGLETLRIWASAPERSSRRLGFEKMVVQLARSTSGEDLPSPLDLKLAERDLRAWGVCGALSEERHDVVFVHPDACCPDEIQRFCDASREARKEGSAVFDKIMRMAQGRS